VTRKQHLPDCTASMMVYKPNGGKASLWLCSLWLRLALLHF